MKISIFGLGYVGSVSAACFAANGHSVTGVDLSRTKVDMINAGHALIIEPGLSDLTATAVKKGLLKATTDARKAVLESEITFICVGTPSHKNNSINLTYVKNVCREIGLALKDKINGHTVICRSTVFPGTMRKTVIPTLEKYSGKKEGLDFFACINPEFMMEGSAVHDFYHPPKNVIGTVDRRGCSILTELNRQYTGMETHSLDIESAELIKYCDNIWHALKVGYANEIGNMCKALSLDSHQVMDIFCLDTKLNISPHYLKPGFAFGGSCLPKDLRAFIYESKNLDVPLPIISSVLPSNSIQINNAIDMVVEQGNQEVGILGFSFKAGTDDLRESPMIELIERLIGKGYRLTIFDSNVSAGKLHGANREYIENKIPHISDLMVPSVDDVLQKARTIVIGNHADEFSSVPDRLNSGQVVIDLVRIRPVVPGSKQYMGICW